MAGGAGAVGLCEEGVVVCACAEAEGIGLFDLFEEGGWCGAGAGDVCGGGIAVGAVVVGAVIRGAVAGG